MKKIIATRSLPFNPSLNNDTRGSLELSLDNSFNITAVSLLDLSRFILDQSRHLNASLHDSSFLLDDSSLDDWVLDYDALPTGSPPRPVPLQRNWSDISSISDGKVADYDAVDFLAIRDAASTHGQGNPIVDFADQHGLFVAGRGIGDTVSGMELGSKGLTSTKDTRKTVVGAGNFGTVKSVYAADGRVLALKKITINPSSPTIVSDLLSAFEEINALRQASGLSTSENPFIGFHRASLHFNEKKGVYQIRILMEHGGTPITPLFVQDGPQVFLSKALGVLADFQDNNFCSLDIHPGNLLAKDGHIKVVDYGLGRELSDVENMPVYNVNYSHISPTFLSFRSRASIEEQKKEFFGQDQFSMGLAVLRLIAGHPDCLTHPYIAIEPITRAASLTPLLRATLEAVRDESVKNILKQLILRTPDTEGASRNPAEAVALSSETLRALAARLNPLPG